MTVSEVLKECQKRGISLWTEGNGLFFSGPTAALTADLETAIEEHRVDLFLILSGLVQPEEAWSRGPLGRLRQGKSQMTVSEILGECRRRGIAIWAEGDELRCLFPEGTLTEDLSAAISEHGEELLHVLGAPAKVWHRGYLDVAFESRLGKYLRAKSRLDTSKVLPFRWRWYAPTWDLRDLN